MHLVHPIPEQTKKPGRPGFLFLHGSSGPVTPPELEHRGEMDGFRRPGAGPGFRRRPDVDHNAILAGRKLRGHRNAPAECIPRLQTAGIGGEDGRQGQPVPRLLLRVKLLDHPVADMHRRRSGVFHMKRGAIAGMRPKKVSSSSSAARSMAEGRSAHPARSRPSPPSHSCRMCSTKSPFSATGVPPTVRGLSNNIRSPSAYSPIWKRGPRRLRVGIDRDVKIADPIDP